MTLLENEGGRAEPRPHFWRYAPRACELANLQRAPLSHSLKRLSSASLQPNYSAKTLVSRHEHKIAIVKIPTQRSRPYSTTMQRSFGTQISGNRRPGAELLEVARARIITASEAGVSKLEITADYRVNRSTIYDIIN
jgi:hypothetical protein